MGKLKRSQKGFTIVEVMIVLAIAGLIMLVVLLAVPALQRTSRNSQRTSDVNAVGAAVTEFINNNGGKLPTTVATDTDGKLTVSGASGTNTSEGKLAYYTGGVSLVTTVPATNATTEDTLIVVQKAKCTANAAVAGTGRGIAITYTLEKASKQCQEL